jgi:hypothetical protein
MLTAHDNRRLQRRARVGSGDVGVRVWRAHNGRIELIGEPEIVKKKHGWLEAQFLAIPFHYWG